MAVVINTNVDSLKIQNLLTSSTNSMSTSMQRMSSGLKIINAKDDAAGSVISAKMNVQLDGNKIAQNNVQNGNALLSTAEGNIDVVLDNMSRIRDLTLQAKNGTYSKEEIQAMEDEVVQRIAEIDRVASSSMYSSMKLFGETALADDGTTKIAAGLAADGAIFQVGANADKDNTITADKTLFDDISFGHLTGRGFELDDYKVEVAAALDDDTITTQGKAADAFAVPNTKPDYGYKSEKVDYYATADADADVAGQKEVITDILCYNSDTETISYVSIDDFNADIALGDESVLTAVKESALKETGLHLTALDKDGMKDAIELLDGAIDNLTNRKSIIGSAQNRLDSALDTLTTQYENLSSAKSIITDADIASEASTFTQQQILQQVSTSLLAQANQAPSIALSLV